MASIARRDLFRGRFQKAQQRARPPYAVPEADFTDLCNGCPDCAVACEENMIRIDANALPVMQFGQAECTFCGECVKACPTGALDAAKARPWPYVASIKKGCLALNGIVCRTCGDVCDEEAIHFTLMTGGRALPEVDEENCTGCGACASTCPNKSIGMTECDHPRRIA